MKAIIKIAALMLLAVQCVLASQGSLLMCLHKDGTGHVVEAQSTPSHAEADCCDHQPRPMQGDQPLSMLDDDCRTCIDIAVKGQEVDAIANGKAAATQPSPVLLATLPDLSPRALNALIVGPPAFPYPHRFDSRELGAVDCFTRTIRIRC